MRFSISFFCTVVLLMILSFFWLDTPIENAFFNFCTYTWWVQGKVSLWHFVFYSLPKLFYGCVIGALFLFSPFSIQGRRYFIVACALIIAPVLVALLKPLFGHECPKDLLFYGGQQPHFSWMTAWQIGTGRCFPAGHVSAGFGLYALLPLTRERHQSLLFSLITIWGSLMGAYQLARGYHFLSHNLATQLLCYGLAWGVGCLLTHLDKRCARPLFG